MGCRRDWMVVLLPNMTLVLLFLMSTSMPWQSWHGPYRWIIQRGHSHMTAWETTRSTALGLLANQQAQLLACLNDTPTAHPYMSSKEFVAKQLAVNRQLQELLVTPIDGGDGDAAASTYTATHPLACRRTGGSGGEDDARVGTRGIPWHPSRGRYLVMLCDSGQVSNHLVCLRKHMWFAALLKRTLVLPPGSLDYKYEHLLDIAHLQQCLGSGSKNSSDVVMTFDDFEAARGNNLHVDKLICYMHDCYFDKEHQSKWEELGFTFGTRHDVWSSSAQQTGRHSQENIVASFGAGEEEVIAVGDLFYAEVEDSDYFAIVSHGCQSVVRPHRSIVVAAQRFVQTYLGGGFLAVHFRRHGFLVFCNKQAPGPSCFYPIPQAARCIESKVHEARVNVVFLSTDAAESEISELVAVLAQRGVTVVRRSTAHEALAKWDAVLWRQAGRESEAGVMAMVDKAICAMAEAFVGTHSSSFSAHIQSMRRDMLTASSCDASLCDGFGPPSFQAPQD